MAMANSSSTPLRANNSLIFHPLPFERQHAEYLSHPSTVPKGYIPPDFVIVAVSTENASEAIEEYQRVRLKVIEMLKKQLPAATTAWGLTLIARKLISRGWSTRVIVDNLFTPTIYIVCSDPTAIEDSLLLLSSSCFLRIEVHQGFVVTHGGCIGYEVQVTMGRSIGCQNSTGSGSFGGWLEDMVTRERLGLSAGHVCMANQIGALASLPATAAINTVIVQPSEDDYSSLLQEAEEVAETAERQSAACGYLHPLLERRNQAAKQELHRVQGFGSRVLGEVEHAIVAVTSGLEDGREKTWKDYGVIRALPGREGPSAYGYLNSRAAAPPSMVDLVSGHVPLYPAQTLRKSFTRSTQEVTVTVNGMFLETNLVCVLLQRPELTITQEWIVIGENGAQASEPGDSGAILVDKDNRAAGMVIGGMKELYEYIGGGGKMAHNITIISPATDILRWIKQDLGRDVDFCP